MTDLARSLSEVLRRIEAAARRVGRDPADIRLVAVTKAVSIAEIEALAALGVGDVGENRVLEALERRRAVPPSLRWHMVGRVQTNKVGRLLEWADVLHSVDRPDLAAELEKRLAAFGRRLPCFVQVNVSGEATKAGFRPEEAEGVVAALRRGAPHLEILGLMTMAPEGADARPHFRRLRELAERCGMRDLSMGMSGDFEVAVEEGATCVRIGSALFGA